MRAAFLAGMMATFFTMSLFVLLIMSIDPDKGGVGILFLAAFVAIWAHAFRRFKEWVK